MVKEFESGDGGDLLQDMVEQSRLEEFALGDGGDLLEGMVEEQRWLDKSESEDEGVYRRTRWSRVGWNSAISGCGDTEARG